MRGFSTNVVPLVAMLATCGAVSVAPASAATSSSPYNVWTVAGSGVQCTTPPACADSLPAAGARLSLPEGVAVSPNGDVYIADAGDNEIRQVTPAGAISVIAGMGTICQRPPGCENGGPATDARLSSPDGVAVDAAGDVYIADTGDNEIREVSPGGKIRRIAGTGVACAHPPKCGDGGPATSAALNGPADVVLGAAGNLYIVDTGDHEIRRVSKSGVITRVAGTGKPCAKPPACGDGGAATSARLRFPEGIALGRSGALYIADSGDQEIRKVSVAGRITTVAGSGKPCASAPSCGDGGPATSARLNFPNAVAVGPAGTLFIADSSDNELRAVNGTKIIRVAGTGEACAKAPDCGDNQRAGVATLNYPASVAVDRDGNIYVADSGDNEIRWLARVHADRISTATGPVALGAFQITVSKRSVRLRFIIGRPANVELTVRHGGRSGKATTGRAHAGFNVLSWNRRFRGKPATKGRYTLILSAALGAHSGAATVHVRL